MDSPELSSISSSRSSVKRGPLCSLCHCCIVLLISLIFSFFFSLFCGLLYIAIGSFSVSRPVSVPSFCRIVSSSVDLRSSKVCELGLLNYKAQNVFYPLERTRFRCRYDYYWASIFEVELKEDSSGQILHAFAEAPKEALPLDCRPSFGAAWSMKDKFKVNETYNCKYMPGISEVDIYSDSLFNCRTKEPSMFEMIRRSFVLFTRSIPSLFSTTETVRSSSLGAVTGIAAGTLVPIILIVLGKLLQESKARLAGKWNARKVNLAAYEARLRRACLLLAYISAMGWLAAQYGKMLGLSEFFPRSYVGEKPWNR